MQLRVRIAASSRDRICLPAVSGSSQSTLVREMRRAQEPCVRAEPTDVKTKFRRRRDWPGWHPDRGALRAFVELIGATWVEASAFSLELIRLERSDTTDDVADALQLLDSEAALAAASTIEVAVFGTSGTLDSMVFRRGGTSASLTISLGSRLDGPSISLYINHGREIARNMAAACPVQTSPEFARYARR